MDYKLLLADADNTLFDFHAAEAAAISATFSEMNIPVTGENTALYSAINEDLWKALERGEVTQEELRVLRFQRFLTRIGNQEADPQVMSLAFIHHLGQGTFLMPGALDFVKTISRAMPIAIVTNGIAAVQRSRMKKSIIAPYVSHLVISEEVGAAKPDPKMLAAAVEKAGVSKAETILLGDSESADIAAACRFGIPSIRILWGHEKSTPSKANHVVSSLEEAQSILLGSAAEGKLP